MGLLAEVIHGIDKLDADRATVAQDQDAVPTRKYQYWIKETTAASQNPLLIGGPIGGRYWVIDHLGYSNLTRAHIPYYYIEVPYGYANASITSEANTAGQTAGSVRDLLQKTGQLIVAPGEKLWVSEVNYVSTDSIKILMRYYEVAI